MKEDAKSKHAEIIRKIIQLRLDINEMRRNSDSADERGFLNEAKVSLDAAERSIARAERSQ
jgi:hypothetical protein